METQFYDSIVDRVNDANSCSDLTAIESEALATLADQATAALAIVNKFKDLIAAPTNLNEVKNWISNYILLIIGPYNEALAFPAVKTTAELQITAAIAAKRSELGC